ncbi:MAG: ABC transporter substrate-binding protein [Anaerolineaceae bacterium]
MSKKPINLLFAISVLLPLLAGCALPAQLTASLPFLSRLQPLNCDLIRAGILIGDDSDEVAKEQRDGYEVALQQINANGGVKGCPLQLYYQTEEETGSTNASSRQTYQAIRSLVEDDKVVALLGGSSSSASMTAASLANYFNVPILIPSAGGSHILPEENRWGFRFHALESSLAGTVFELVKAEFGAKVQTVIVFEDTTFGHDAAIAAVNAAQTNEMDITGYFAYNPSQTGSDVFAKQIMELQPQLIYLAFSDTAEAQKVLLALQAEKGALGIIEIARAGGYATRDFLLNTSPETLAAVQNLILVTRWSGDTESADTAGDEAFVTGFAEYTAAQYGKAQEPTLYNAEAYKALMILADSLKSMLTNASQSPTELKKMREDLRQTLFNYKEVSPVWGLIDFTAGGQNQSGVSLLQLFGGNWKVVYPSGKAETDLYFDFQPR